MSRSLTLPALTADEQEEARGWLLDCGADDDLVSELTAVGLAQVVNRECEGGLVAFLQNIR